MVLMIENQFRAAPTEVLLLPLGNVLRVAGCAVKIIIGSGKVGPLSDDEIRTKLGDELYGYGLPVCSNDVGKPEDDVFKGVSTRGIPIWVHRRVYAAEIKITLGTAQATLWGYGGSGMVIPGTANNETIEMNHITSWAVVNVDPVTKDDGTILFASPCPGCGAWEGFALMDLLKAYMPPSPAHNEEALKDFYSHKNELWAGCIWYKVYEVMVRKATEYITLNENLAFAKDVELAASGPAEVQKVFDRLLAKYGPNAAVAFVPFGRYTVLR